jgi:diacylglycerol kinase
MKKKEAFSFRKRISSFRYAWNGLGILLKEEHNSWIHLFFTLLALTLGWLLHVSTIEWFAIIFSIGIVFTAELFNSSIENLADLITQSENKAVGRIKDLAAAAVLISAVTAFSIGLIIFAPKLYVLFL